MKILVKRIVTQTSRISIGDFKEPDAYKAQFMCNEIDQEEAPDSHSGRAGNSTYRVNYHVIEVEDTEIKNKKQFLLNFQQHLNEKYSSTKIESKELKDVLEKNANDFLNQPYQQNFNSKQEIEAEKSRSKITITRP